MKIRGYKNNEKRKIIERKGDEVRKNKDSVQKRETNMITWRKGDGWESLIRE